MVKAFQLFHRCPPVDNINVAGKHVYCEKSAALKETELNELYKAVKESGITYQLGHLDDSLSIHDSRILNGLA